MKPQKIRALIFNETTGNHSAWVAQCLEYDIGTQANNEEDIRYELDRTLAAHIAISEDLGVGVFEGITSAPKQYFELWDNPPEGVTKITVDFPPQGWTYIKNKESNNLENA